jgi:uncharacterized membrane protein HdeD (DUF308 family)
MKENQMSEEREKIRQVASAAKQHVSNKLDDIGWWFMIRGILALSLAVVALFWPEKTIGILVKLLGAYLLIDGVIGAVGAFRSGGQRGFPVFAIVSMAVGAILIFWTGISVRFFLTLVGVWALLQGAGIFLSNRSADSDTETRQLFGTVGAVLAVAGLILIVWPGTGIVAISWLIAVVASIIGCVLILIASRLRRLKKRVGTVRDDVRPS